MNEKKLDILSQNVDMIKRTINGVIFHSTFLTVTGKSAELRDEAVKILKSKMDLLEKAETVDDVKQVIRVKKLLNDKDGKKDE